MSFGEWAHAQRFLLLKDQAKRDYANFFKNQPYQHARYMLSNILLLQRWHYKEYLAVVDGTSLDGLKGFVGDLLGQVCDARTSVHVIPIRREPSECWACRSSMQMHIVMSVGGNMDDSEAQAAVRITTAPCALFFAPLPPLRVLCVRGVAEKQKRGGVHYRLTSS